MKRLYSLFEKRGHRYHRVSQLAYSKAVAVHVFQTALIVGPAHYLRPVSDTWSDGRRIYSPPVEQFEQNGERSGKAATIHTALNKTEGPEHDPKACGCRYLGSNLWSCGHSDLEAQ